MENGPPREQDFVITGDAIAIGLAAASRIAPPRLTASQNRGGLIGDNHDVETWRISVMYSP
jgi:hypothetical protein